VTWEKEFINAAELIMGKLEAADSISITQTTESKEITERDFREDKCP